MAGARGATINTISRPTTGTGDCPPAAVTGTAPGPRPGAGGQRQDRRRRRPRPRPRPDRRGHRGRRRPGRIQPVQLRQRRHQHPHRVRRRPATQRRRTGRRPPIAELPARQGRQQPRLHRAVPATADDRLGHPGPADQPGHRHRQVPRPDGQSRRLADRSHPGPSPRRCRAHRPATAGSTATPTSRPPPSSPRSTPDRRRPRQRRPSVAVAQAAATGSTCGQPAADASAAAGPRPGVATRTGGSPRPRCARSRPRRPCNSNAAPPPRSTSSTPRSRPHFGQNIGITDGYRSYDEQVACRLEKGSLCANPGTSNHGWGKAVDIGACCGVNTGTGAGLRLAHRQRRPLRLEPPRLGATRRLQTRTLALGVRRDLVRSAPYERCDTKEAPARNGAWQ